MLSPDQEEQFWVFYHKTAPALFRKAFRMCGGHQADAEDAHQKAYIKALEHWTTVAALVDSQRYAWMVTTLTREVLQIWRAPYRTKETETDDSLGALQPTAIDGLPDDNLVTRDCFRQACRAIAQLNGRQSEIMILHCIAGYEVSEISEMLNLSSSTVRVHLHGGRKRLLATIAGEEETNHG